LLWSFAYLAVRNLFALVPLLVQRLYVLFFISLATRRIEYIACSSNPDGAWTAQQARNLVMQLGGDQPTMHPCFWQSPFRDARPFAISVGETCGRSCARSSASAGRSPST